MLAYACACECFDSKVNSLKRYLNFPQNLEKTKQIYAVFIAIFNKRELFTL